MNSDPIFDPGFEYGDIVFYDYTDVKTSKKDDIAGRVVGKFTKEFKARNSASMFFSRKPFDILIFKPMEGEEDRLEQAGFFKIYSGTPENFHNLDLEYGHFPTGKWAAVRSDRIENSIVEGSMRLNKRNGLCPRCGDEGRWINFALVCDWHGRFI